ncbi:MAG: glycosyltransferase family 2 protein [Candidatus Eremiobacteraeota bacterium]|nr:glycosyltransferase family 2 protein [Candidatus Eremiobacteraeota bacterium]MBV8222548.1 glycosyltransferase family 2 protein [Candidatus Eremiobacteraeota bacterium]MBV8281686.1 glycosyltransferase family 2 protein [Candidatus Eremiobacteraeota bacterium]
MNITVAILAYNEEQSIGLLLDTICATNADPHRIIEVLVYDDCSNDATAEIVDAASRGDLRIRRLASATRKGTMAGMEALTRAARGDVMVKVDADILPLDDAIARLVDAIARGASLAVGSREAVVERRNIASRSAEFAASVVERLKATAYTEHYAVGQLAAYRTSAMRGLAFPTHLISEDRYISGSIGLGGGTAAFEPAARCKFRVPHTFRDYSRQSRRILEGLRQLETIGIKRAPFRVVLRALVASALTDPMSALCWAFAYGASSLRPAPAYTQPWPVATTTKGKVA